MICTSNRGLVVFVELEVDFTLHFTSFFFLPKDWDSSVMKTVRLRKRQKRVSNIFSYIIYFLVQRLDWKYFNTCMRHLYLSGA